MKVRFFTFEQYHGKGNIGSTRIRVHYLIDRWDEAELYRYGENPDVLIFQKVYLQPDYRFPEHFEGIKILDICDPDWLSEQQNVVETINAMDGVTCPTESLKEFLEQLTDKPIRVIPDRHNFPVLQHSKSIQAKYLERFGSGSNKTPSYTVRNSNARKTRSTKIATTVPNLAGNPACPRLTPP